MDRWHHAPQPVLLKQFVVFHDARTLELTVGCQQFPFDHRRGDNRLTGTKAGTVAGKLVTPVLTGNDGFQFAQYIRTGMQRLAVEVAVIRNPVSIFLYVVTSR